MQELTSNPLQTSSLQSGPGSLHLPLQNHLLLFLFFSVFHLLSNSKLGPPKEEDSGKCSSSFFCYAVKLQ